MEKVPEQTIENVGVAENLVELEELLNVKSSEIEKVTGELESKLDSIEKVNPEKAKEVRGKIKRLYGRFLTGFEIASVVFLAGTATYKATRYEVSEKVAQDKSIEYIHEDKETTEILNYLSGRAELNEESRLKIIRYMIVETFKRSKMEYPKELDEATEEEIPSIVSRAAEAAKLKGHRMADYLGFTAEILVKDKNWSNTFVPRKLEFNAGIYEALWKVEKMSGNPKIRWLDLNDMAKSTASLVNSPAIYNSITNTAYIRSPEEFITIRTDFPISIQAHHSVTDFVAESSHAKQFNDKPISSIGTWLKDDIETLIRTLKTGNFNKAYSLTYIIPGTLEYNAHSEIEEEFKKEFTPDMGARRPPYRGHRH